MVNIEYTAKKTIQSKQRADTSLLITILVLVVFGLIMMFSASHVNAWVLMGDSFYYIKKQIIYAVVGLIFMIVISHIDYHILHRFAWPLVIASQIMLIITLFMPPISGAKRWIIVGSSFTFQPSELAKFAIICLIAHIASIKPAKMKEFKYGFLQPMAIMIGFSAVMLFQTHLSGMILILLVGLILMFISGTKMRYFFLAAGVVVPAGLAFVMLTDKMAYAATRIQMWLNPFADSSSDGYQTIQSLLAIGSGGLMGLGLGNSRQKHLYVPEPQNDFIFSIICEELGFIGAVFVVVLFLIFIFRGFSIALNAKDKFGAIMAIGITAQIGLQAMLNIAVVSNTIPNTGISLPFFSAGGSSLVLLLMEVGVLLSVSRYSATRAA